MAYTESGEIATNKGYTLGEYSFSIERSSVPGSSNDQITAICRQGSKSARKSIQVPSSTHIGGWYVETDETEATVYIMVASGPNIPDGVINCSGSGGGVLTNGTPYSITFTSSGMATHYVPSGNRYIGIFASGNPGTSMRVTLNNGQTELHPLSSSVTYGGKTAYYTTTSGTVQSAFPVSSPSIANYPVGDVAWNMIYGNAGAEDSRMVGRFAIELQDADPGGWIDPGDYDPDWEQGDPTYTLHLDVIGALSGRHNDPVYNPSYSYLPADKATIKQYGSGGDGGHGGGGGAGAATVVVHRIATNKAENHEVTALAKRHGYGSGGGKGGKGGDGIILIYY